jgi:hypothetical protein
MTCPLREYRDGDGDRSFDVARAYCTAVDAFVQPMRADVCNDRYDLHHAEDCEFYDEHVRTPDDGEDSSDVTGSGEEA